MAVSGDVIVVGSPRADIGGTFDQGTATVFRWNGATWVEEQRLDMSSSQQFANFGTTVAAFEDTIAVGAPRSAVGGAFDQGSVSVFRFDGATWNEEQELLARNGQGDESFGASVALGADVLAIGAPGETIGSVSFEGATYVFEREAGTWSQVLQLVASDGSSFLAFGQSVALSGNTSIMSAPYAIAAGDRHRARGLGGKCRGPAAPPRARHARTLRYRTTTCNRTSPAAT